MERFILLLITLSGLPISFYSVRNAMSDIIMYSRLLKRGFREEDISNENQCVCPDCKEKEAKMTADEITQEKKLVWDSTKFQMRASMFEQIFYSFFYGGVTLYAIFLIITNLK